MIVGAGPAGMFTALRLLEAEPRLQVAMLDKGGAAMSRPLPVGSARFYPRDNSRRLLSGAGGAGLFSDGKLVLGLHAGGSLPEIVDEHTQGQYVSYVENALLSCDGTSRRIVPTQDNFGRKRDVRFKSYSVRHFSTHALPSIVERFFGRLLSFPGFRVFFSREVVGLRKVHAFNQAVAIGPGGAVEEYCGENLVLSVGKEGARWLAGRLSTMGVGCFPNRTYVGLRVESPGLRGLSGLSGDPKLSQYFADGTKIKTHCFCKGGEILALRYGSHVIAGSHSPGFRGSTSENVVFGALLGDAPDRRLSWEELDGFLGQGSRRGGGALIVQRLGDYRRGVATRRSVLERGPVLPSCRNVVAGNIASLAFPFGFKAKFAEFIERLGRLGGDSLPEEALLYFPAAEWWMKRIETDSCLETESKGVFVNGDGAGISQGIMHAAASGLLVADSILGRKRG